MGFLFGPLYLILMFNNSSFVSEKGEGESAAPIQAVSKALMAKDLAGQALGRRDDIALPTLPSVVEHEGQKMVYIQGKYYRYNPKGVYKINGVPTFYQPPQISKTQMESVTDNKIIRSGLQMIQGQKTAINKPSSIMHAYSAKGMDDLKANLDKINSKMKERNKILKQIE